MGTQQMRSSENVEFDFKKEHLEFILIGGKEKNVCTDSRRRVDMMMGVYRILIFMVFMNSVKVEN